MDNKNNFLSAGIGAVDTLLKPLRKVLGKFYYPAIFFSLFTLFQILFVIPVSANGPLLDLYVQQIINLVLINIVMTVSLGMINGFTGQFSIGHAGFMALGAYTSVFITTILPNLLANTPWGSALNVGAMLNSGNPAAVLLSYGIFAVSLVLGGIVAGIGGFLIGTPTLRLKGDYLAIVTMAFCEVIRTIIRVSPVLGGPRGVTGIPMFINPSTFFIVVAFTLISVYAMRNYIFSSFGRASKAIRDNEISAEAMGVNTTKQKISVFVIASFIAGIGGGLYAHLLAFIHPDNFTFMKSLEYLIYLYIGGSATISGAVTGATIFTIIPEAFRFLDKWRLVLYPLVLILVMLWKTDGMVIREFRIFLPKKLREIRRKQREQVSLSQQGEDK